MQRPCVPRRIPSRLPTTAECTAEPAGRGQLLLPRKALWAWRGVWRPLDGRGKVKATGGQRLGFPAPTFAHHQEQLWQYGRALQNPCQVERYEGLGRVLIVGDLLVSHKHRHPAANGVLVRPSPPHSPAPGSVLALTWPRYFFRKSSALWPAAPGGEVGFPAG